VANFGDIFMSDAGASVEALHASANMSAAVQ
jgi:hypothetical protein